MSDEELKLEDRKVKALEGIVGQLRFIYWMLFCVQLTMAVAFVGWARS